MQIAKMSFGGRGDSFSGGIKSAARLKRLTPEFFARPTLVVARDLLGKILAVRNKKTGKILRARIVETEAYRGENDLACHASKGRTKRTETLYAEPGTIYVYLIYGMYHCLNIVTEKKDFPAAVLIRAVEPLEGKKTIKPSKTPAFGNWISKRRTDGPGKSCRAMGIDRSFNKEKLGKRIWVENASAPGRGKIARGKRVGVDYAGDSAHCQWRFYIKNNPFVSKRIGNREI